MSKKTLTIVLAAGASVTAGVPSTATMTDLTDEVIPGKTSKQGWPWPLSATPPPGESVSDAFAVRLRGVLKTRFANAIYPHGYHFENLLGAVEELDDYAWRRTMVSTVTKFDTADSVLDDTLLLGATRVDLTRAIHKHIGEAASKNDVRNHPDARQVRKLLERLAKHFRLVVIDLNYDDIADDARIRWADGFTSPLKEGGLVFDPRAWQRQVEDPHQHLLIHLHGSIRWGQRPYGTTWISTPEEPAKYPSYDVAKGHVSGGSSNVTVDGRSYSAPYVISGIGKGPKFIYNLRPYGHYQSALARLVPAADALLTIGYGWADEHVNALLAESFDLRPNIPAAVIMRRTGSQVGDNTSLPERYLQSLSRGAWLKLNTWAYVDNPYEPKRRSWVAGRLLLLPYGVPLPDREIKTLERHLRRRRSWLSSAFAKLKSLRGTVA